MTFPRTWSAEHVRAVMTTESRQKSRALFLSTHRPFKRIHVDFCKERTTESFIDEEELRTIIHDGPLYADNRLFFIVGEAGSGKSELCQWLEYTADSSTRVAVHIPRSMTTAIGVASLLRSRLGVIAPVGYHSTPKSTQAQLIVLSALSQWYEAGSSTLPAWQPWEHIFLAPALTQAVAAYLQDAEDPHSAFTYLVNEETLAEVCADYGLRLDGATLARCATTVSEFIMRAMERITLSSDVRALLRSLSESAVNSGRRPLLLIEDITAFQTFGDVLLDYLLDLTSGHLDAVIGVTTGFERTQLPYATLSGDLTHVHHRLRARLALTDEHGCAYGLSDDLIEFARAYLRAVKHEAANVVLQDAPVGFDADLYPFTETALRRAFVQLQEDGNTRQTPRLFIEHVLAAALLAPDSPPATLDASPYLRRPPTYVRREAVADSRLSALIRWYADVDNDAVTLDARIPSAWNISTPPDAIRGDKLIFPRAYVAHVAEPLPTPSEWERELAELQQWLDQGGRYPSRELLKRAVERVLRDLGDPRALGNPASISQNKAELYYARGDERLPIIICDGSGDEDYPGGAVALHVTRNVDERAILEELALRELTGVPLAEGCQNVALTLDWAGKRFETYQRRVREEFSRRLNGINPDELVLLSWKLLAFLCGAPWSEIPHLAPLPSSSGDDEVIGPWSRAFHPACFAAGHALEVWRDEVRRLFIGAFALHDTFLDIERFRAVSTRMHPARALECLASLPASTLGGFPFKIKTSNLALKHLLLDLQRYADALQQLDVSTALGADLEQLAQQVAHLRAQQAMDMDALSSRLDELRERSGALGVHWRSAWTNALSVLAELRPNAFYNLLQCADHQYAEGKQLQTGDCDLWMYQAWRLKTSPVIAHPYWAAREALAGLQRELALVARQRTPAARKTLAGTRAYRALLGNMRLFEQEIHVRGQQPD